MPRDGSLVEITGRIPLRAWFGLLGRVGIRYDDNNKTMTLSVGDILESGMPRGHLILDLALSRLGRLKAGREVHTAYQDARLGEDGSFQAEVRLKHQLVVHEWTVQINGRLDGLTVEAGRSVVEEVKSTALAADRLLQTDVGDWPSYIEQLELYLWMLEQARYDRPFGRLVLVSLLDGSKHIIGIQADINSIDAFVRGRLSEFIQARERRQSWLASRQGLTVPLPFASWRPGQEGLADAVEQGLKQERPILLEAPTGLGKTAAALVGVLQQAFRNRQQVYWATSRTTQQRVVEETIRRVQRQGIPLRFTTLSSKERACLNEVIDCRPESCPYAANYYDKLRAHSLVETLVDQGGGDTAELAAIGEEHTVCPYQLGRDVSQHSDVVIGDYNYAFDPTISSRRCPPEKESKQWVVVVDEAHGLVERARAYGSPMIAAQWCQEALELFRDQPSYSQFAYLAREIEYLVADAAENMISAPRHGRALTEVSNTGWSELAERLDEVAIDYARLKSTMPLVSVGEEDPWLKVARGVLRFAEVLKTAGEETVAVVKVARDDEELGLLCLDPAPVVGPRIRGFGGFVAMSATLSPVDYYRDLLGMQSLNPISVSAVNPFPPENRLVLVAPRVSTTFADRGKHAEATARLIEECAGAIQGNVAVYFPSFAMLEDIRSRWSLEDTLLAQAPRMSDHERSAMLDELGTSSHKIVLFAVLGGIFAEGVDLPEGSLAGVLVVGPSLPPVGLERDLIRSYCEERFGQGFQYASLIPGMTRVVQAAGRLIRRPTDRGVVVLIGRRFRWRDYASLLPVNWNVAIAEDPSEGIRQFWESS
jgi:DNA excision repair protein ERCC-2